MEGGGGGGEVPSAPGVDDPEVGSLLLAEAEEHRLRFFGVAGLGGVSWGSLRATEEGAVPWLRCGGGDAEVRW